MAIYGTRVACCILLSLLLLVYLTLMTNEFPHQSLTAVWVLPEAAAQNDSAARLVITKMADSFDGQVVEDGQVDSDRKFDVTIVYESLQRCEQNANGIDLDSYIKAYKELHRFFQLLGSVFSFVASDIHSKIEILEGYRQSDIGDNYETIEGMIIYEEANNLLTKPQRPSGARTLLRLHRALEFISSLMKSLSAANDEDPMSVIARKCYSDTLAKFHTWIIRKSVMLAAYSLPTRRGLIEKVYGDAPPHEISLLGEVADIAEKVYQQTQVIYEEHDLLELP